MTEWFEPTPRKKITTKERTDIFMRAKGICGICTLRIMPGQEWDAEHPTPLWASGSDARTDLVPVHRKCHQVKTRAEASQRAKETRVRQKFIGSHQSRSPMGFGRNSRLKKKITGEIVDRATGEIIQ
jgi:5-methylcytosine-specific restriction endonuclease McrA